MKAVVLAHCLALNIMGVLADKLSWSLLGENNLSPSLWLLLTVILPLALPPPPLSPWIIGLLTCAWSPWSWLIA